jgi:RHS repeat-associated protein
MSYASEKHRFGYNGKLKDDDIKGVGNSLDFGARMLDTRLGRFMAIDPMRAKFAGWSAYSYCLNNSIRWVDKDGLLPGDPFKTILEAVHDFGKNYNAISILENREIGTTIYKYKDVNGNNRYTYGVPVMAYYDECYPSLATADNDGYSSVAYSHTHGGNYKESDERIMERYIKKDVKLKGSENQLSTADKKMSLPSYMIGPAGFIFDGGEDPVGAGLPSDLESREKNINQLHSIEEDRPIPLRYLNIDANGETDYTASKAIPYVFPRNGPNIIQPQSGNTPNSSVPSDNTKIAPH